MEIEPNKGELISQGAEAKVYKTIFLNDLCIVKERFKKSYRNEILDTKLRNHRTVSESKNMNRARKAGVNTPYVMFVDLNDCKIYMQYIENSIMVKDYFYITNRNKYDISDLLLEEIGDYIAKIHEIDLVHGDLTTSYIMIKFNSESDLTKLKNNIPVELTKNNHSLYLIDFGLSFVSSNVEDKAVDLYVLEKAFLSTHTESEKEFDKILEHYKLKSKKAGTQIMARLDEVKKRGRKKLAFG